MNREELENINTDYMLKNLAVEIKELDLSLTKYLTKDVYKPQNINKDELIDNVSYIKNLLTYIIEEYKKETEDYKELYKIKDIEEYFKDSEIRRKTWLSLLEVEDKINKYNNIKVQINKGFDFDFGYSNCSSLSIYYVVKENGCRTLYPILTITSTNGLNFGVYVTDKYYEFANIENNKNNSFHFDTQFETVNKIDELVLAVL